MATDVTVIRGTTWRITIPVAVPGEWDRLEFTARLSSKSQQSDSLLWVVVINPAGESDGLQLLNGETADSPDDATIVTEDVDNPVVLVQATSKAEIPVGEYSWDCKQFSAGEVTQLAAGTACVDPDVTRTAA